MNRPQLNPTQPTALQHQFNVLYGQGPVHCLRAPARINVLGEHIDYVSYLPTASLPFGSHEHAMVMHWRPRADGRVRGASLNAAYEPFEFALADLPYQATNWEALLTPQPAHWSTYVKGACAYAQWQAGAPLVNGFDFLLDSTIPPRGGSSSSSALVCLTGAALRLANDIAFTPASLARDSAQAEWYCGTRGGALDHTAICLSQRGQLVHLQYVRQPASMLPLPSNDYCWVTFFAHEADKGNEVMLEYNERAAVARVLIPALLADLGAHREGFAATWQRSVQTLDCETLRECLTELPPCLTLAELGRHYLDAYAECERLFPALVQARRHEPMQITARALHHLGEIERVQTAVSLLRNEAANPAETMQALGELLNATHVSLRDQYEISTPTVETLRTCILAHPAVLGARLMGGGFGGNVLALLPVAQAEALVDHVQAAFYAPRQRHGRTEGAVMISTPGAGLAVCTG